MSYSALRSTLGLGALLLWGIQFLFLLISCKIANFAREGQLLKTIYICNESTHHGSHRTIGV